MFVEHKTDLDLQRITFHLMLWLSEGMLVKLSSQMFGESKVVIFWWNTAEIRYLQLSCFLPLFQNLSQFYLQDNELARVQTHFNMKGFVQYWGLFWRRCNLELAYSNYCRKGYNAQKWTLRDLKEEDRKKS